MSHPGSLELTQANRDRIAALIEAKGVYEAARLLGVSRHAMERAQYGARCYPGTIALINNTIAVRDAEKKNP
jgi:hypothetical protein